MRRAVDWALPVAVLVAVLAVLLGGCASAVRAFDELVGATRNGVPVAPDEEAGTVSPWWWLLTLAAPPLEKARRVVVRARRARLAAAAGGAAPPAGAG